MAARPRPAVARWTVHSVFVRTRDGPQRLEQAYRHLVRDDDRPDAPRHGPDDYDPATGEAT